MILASDETHKISIENVFPCKITDIKKGKLLSSIRLLYYENELTSIITSQSLEKLNLVPGMKITAMVKTIADVYNFGTRKAIKSKKIVSLVIAITFIQMIFAGLMSGMRAGLYYPSWPNMNGEFLPAVLLNSENWIWENMINYDSYLFAPAFIQFTHRMLAYLLVVITFYMFIKLKRNNITVISKRWLNSTLFIRNFSPKDLSSFFFVRSSLTLYKTSNIKIE